MPHPIRKQYQIPDESKHEHFAVIMLEGMGLLDGHVLVEPYCMSEYIEPGDPPSGTAMLTGALEHHTTPGMRGVVTYLSIPVIPPCGHLEHVRETVRFCLN